MNIENRLGLVVLALSFVTGTVVGAQTTVAKPEDRPVGPRTRTGKSGSDVSDGPLVRAGRDIYFLGTHPDKSDPVTALVAGDVAVDGSQFTCVSCHQRSGWGISEGEVVTLPVAAPSLFEERASGYHRRPGYTDESLAIALRDGADPTGRQLDPLMPRYNLDEEEFAALAAFLRQLSTTLAPGVTESELHFATVVAGDVAPPDSDAMLGVLRRFFDEKNAGTRHEQGRLERGVFFRDYKYKAHRRWILHEWRLAGNPDTWREQLDAAYTKQPIFAMVSGLASGSWSPVHEFCEQREIPCVLPNTDLPLVVDDDYYTLYFSSGIELDARVLLEFMNTQGWGDRIVQIAADSELAKHASESLATLAPLGEPVQTLKMSSPDADSSGSAASMQPSALVLWLGDDQLQHWESPPLLGNVPVFVSSRLVTRLDSIPESLRSRTYVVHPFQDPWERRLRAQRVDGWLGRANLAPTHPRLQMQAYFACLLVGEGIMHIKRYFYRGYFLDSIDHSERMANYAVIHARLNFGPGQRYLSKGAFIASWQQLQGEETDLDWLVPR